MKRPEQHITETKSQRLFESIVPIDWVCRDIKPDYGVDFLVEIFEKGESTGKTFFVQLKGSTQAINNNTFEKQFTIDNLNYYNSLALPVLIVCVSVSTQQIWGIWSNNLLKSKKIKDDQKTISISLDERFLIDEKFFQNISSKLNIFNKLGVSFNTDDERGELLNKNIINWINEFYSETISTSFNNLPNHIEINYVTVEDNNIKISIIDISSTQEIILKDFSIDEAFLYNPKFDTNIVNDFNKEILFFIAIKLAKYDIKGSLNILIQIIEKLDFSDSSRIFMLDPLGLLSLANSNNELYLLNKLVKKIIEIKSFQLFFIFDMAYFTIESPILLEYRIENLNEIISKEVKNEIIGTCYYNLGNIYKEMNEVNKAIYHYFKAKKTYKEYLERDYWWREVAGLLFAKSHYQWAEKFYKKSLESFKSLEKNAFGRVEKINLNDKYLVEALIADCLFFQGKFKAANMIFEKFLKLNTYHSEEWILKNMICIDLMDGELNNVKFNKKNSMDLFELGFKKIDNKQAINIFHKALKTNPLNGLVWFNLGVRLDREARYEEALFAFLITGLIQEWDKEAQFNTLMIAFTLKEYNLIQSILLYLIEKHGNLIINDLSTYIINKPVSIDEKRKLINLLTKMFDTLPCIKNMLQNSKNK